MALNLAAKIAFSIIVAGLFIMASFMALNYEVLNAGSYIIFSLLFFYIFMFGIAAGKKYAGPVKELVENVSDAIKGKGAKKLSFDTKDEIEELSKAIEKVFKDSEKNKSETEMIKKSGDIKFKTKSLLSEQLIGALEQKVKNRTMDFEKAIAEADSARAELKIKDLEIIRLREELKGGKHKKR